MLFMHPVLGHQLQFFDHPGYAYPAFLASALAWMIWLVFRGIQREINDEKCYKEALTLFGLSSFIGLGVLAVVGIFIQDRTRLIRFGRIDSRFLWTENEIIWTDYLLKGIALAMLGYLLAFICYNIGGIINSKIAKAVIRYKYYVVGFTAAFLAACLIYTSHVKPVLNRRSLLSGIEHSVIVDAYADPSQVLLYTVYPYIKKAPLPPGWEEEEIVEIDYSATNDYIFEDKVENLNSMDIKRRLDAVYVYRAGDNWGRLNARKVIRFVGTNSVVDIWASGHGRMAIFVNRSDANIEDVLSFSKPYGDLMGSVYKYRLYYHSDNDNWHEELK